MANTIPANNNTGLYNTTGAPIPTSNNIVGNNILATGYVSAAGNIYTSGFYFGDGSQLTNLPPSPSSYGNANVVTLLAGFGSNAVSTTGNVSAGYVFGNGSQLTGITTNYSNSNVVSLMANFDGNPISTTGTVSAGNIGAGNVNVAGTVSATGTVTGGNISTVGVVTATGNITGNYFIGNGSQLTGITAGTNYSNANVASYLASGLNANNIITTANVVGNYLVTPGSSGNITGANYISGNYIVGNGSLLTNLPAANVSGTVANATYATTAGTATSATTAGTVTTNAQPNITSLGTLTSIATSGTVSAVGNITGSYFFGNGSQLTGLPATYGNANVVANLAALGSNPISTTGNVTAGYHIGNGSLLSNITGANVTGTVANATYATSAGSATTATTAGTVTSNAQANITSVGTLTSLSVTGTATVGNVATGGAVSATGNVTGAYYIGNGSLLTGIVSSYGNANVSNYLANYGSNTISTTGNINAGYFVGNFAGNITGNLTVPGSNTQVLFNNNGNAGASAGFVYYSGNSSVSITGNVTAGNVDTGRVNTSNVTSSGPISAVGNITGATLFGTVVSATTLSASGNVIGGNITTGGIVTATGNIVSLGNIVTTNGTGSGVYTGIISAQGTVTGGNLQTAGFVSATGNITGGNIDTGRVNSSNVTVSGPISAVGNITGSYFIGNGSALTGIASSYGNSNVTSLLAAFGSNTVSTTGTITSGNVTASNFRTTGLITATGNITAGNVDTGRVNTSNVTSSGPISAVGNVSTAAYFIGDGSQLTNLPTSSYGNSDVAAFLAAFGSNTVSTTGAVTAGNITGGNLLTGGVISATGKITSGAVTYSNTDGTNGQVLTTYGNGVTYFSTVSGGGGSPGGANTQIQYNDASAFAGNANLTFNNATGNVNLGNVIFTTANATNFINTVTQHTGTPANVTTLGAGQIVIGAGYNGNLNLNNQNLGAARGAKLQFWDTIPIADSGGPRFGGITSAPYFSLTGNVSNNNSSLRAGAFGVYVGGGASNYTYNVNGGFGFTGLSGAATVGQPNTTVAIGNTTVGNALGIGAAVSVNPGSTANNVMGLIVSETFNGTVGNVAGITFSMGGVSVPSNVYAIHMSNTVSSQFGGVFINNNQRSAANYYFLHNEDNLAQNQLGSLRLFNEFRYDGANTSGTLAVNKNNGQVQNIYLTGAITSVTFSNFVTSATDGTNTKYQTDTVTLILHQGSTPYAVTMPTGTAYKYAGGTTTVGTTANAVTMISVTATYDSISSADQYLITISPEFV